MLSLFFPTFAFSWQCQPITTQEALNNADLVFYGHVVDVTKPKRKNSAREISVSFYVIKGYKGVKESGYIKSKYTLKAIYDSQFAGVGYGDSFKKNKDWLIYAKKHNDRRDNAVYWIEECATKLISDAQDDIKTLNNIQIDKKNNDSEKKSN